tara:strand:+ start:167 stop:784 length:618 start_codon:yes stop_codon:yes gene_type:complete
MEYEKRYVSDIYNEISGHFDKTRGYQWSWITEFINSIPHNSSITDIGCGNGRNMLNPNYNFIGIDNCIEFIKICAKQNMNVIQSDMTKIPIKSHSQDAVISIASFHHLSSNARRLEALKEMRRIIKSSGKILISVWSITQPEKTRRKFTEYGDTIVTWNNNRGKIYDRYYYIFNIDEIKELFKKADLILEKHIWDCGNEIFVLHT